MMKLNTNELEFFKTVSETEVGTFLLEYAKRVQDHCFDSRAWPKDGSKESAEHASKMIQECFIDKIKGKKDQEGGKVEDYT